MLRLTNAIWSSTLIGAILCIGQPLRAHGGTDNRFQSAAEERSSEPALSSVSYGPIWKASTGYSTVLVLKSASKTVALAHVSVFSGSGALVGESDIKTFPGQTARVNIADLLHSPPSETTGGGLSVRWSGVSEENVSGQVQIIGPNGTRTSYPIMGGYRFDTENALSVPWWLPETGTEGTLTLFNSTSARIEVASFVEVNSQVKKQSVISIDANATRTLDLRTILTDSGLRNSNTGSIILRYTGLVHALQPILLLSNPHSGFALVPNFAGLHSPQSGLQHPGSTTWAFPYVSLAMQDNLGSRDQTRALTPYALLSNVSGKSLASSLKSYAAIDGRIEEDQLSIPALEPGETRLISLSDLMQQKLIGADRAALTVSYGGESGDISMTIFSVDATDDLAVPARGLPLAVEDSSIGYWDLLSEHPLVHQITSLTGSAESGVAVLYYQTDAGVGRYSVPATLTVDGIDNKVIKFAQILRVRAPDRNGAPLPIGASSGLAVLTSISDPLTPASVTLAALCLTSCRIGQEGLQTHTASSLAFARSSPDFSVRPECGGGPPPPPPQNACFAQLKYRSAAGGLGNHSFWWVQDSTGTQYVIDAGPHNTSCPINCGYLVDWITVGSVGHYAEDNSGQAVDYDSGVSTGVCSGVSRLVSFARSWSQHRYKYALGRAPNSNTFAHQCATAGGFPAAAPPSAPGW